MHIAVIGAGLSGLSAGRNLQRAGHEVVVIDKGAGVGGRMATRRIGDAVLDHGAQFFTVRSDTFAAEVDDWVTHRVAREWCRGFANIDGHPRYVGVDGMTSIAKYLATDVDLRLGTTASSLTFSQSTRQWTITAQTRNSTSIELAADAIVVTAPLPQTIALLGSIADDLPSGLHDIDYDPTLCLLVTLKRQAQVSESGAMQAPDDFFSFVCDNMRKGTSATPCMTFHVEPGVSKKNYDRPDAELHAMMMERAAEYFPVDDVVESHVKKWRYATPRRTFGAAFWTHPHLPLVLAGDAFDGPRVEGAVLSGLAAAKAIS